MFNTSRKVSTAAVALLLAGAACCYIASFTVTTTGARALLQVVGIALTMAVVFLVQAAVMSRRRERSRP